MLVETNIRLEKNPLSAIDQIKPKCLTGCGEYTLENSHRNTPYTAYAAVGTRVIRFNSNWGSLYLARDYGKVNLPWKITSENVVIYCEFHVEGSPEKFGREGGGAEQYGTTRGAGGDGQARW